MGCWGFVVLAHNTRAVALIVEVRAPRTTAVRLRVLTGIKIFSWLAAVCVVSWY